MDKRLLGLAAVLGLALAGCAEDDLVEAANQCRSLISNEKFSDAFTLCEKVCKNNDGIIAS